MMDGRGHGRGTAASSLPDPCAQWESGIVSGGAGGARPLSSALSGGLAPSHIRDHRRRSVLKRPPLSTGQRGGRLPDWLPACPPSQSAVAKVVVGPRVQPLLAKREQASAQIVDTGESNLGEHPWAERAATPLLYFPAVLRDVRRGSTVGPVAAGSRDCACQRPHQLRRLDWLHSIF
jgi:hypothetical protein